MTVRVEAIDCQSKLNKSPENRQGGLIMKELIIKIAICASIVLMVTVILFNKHSIDKTSGRVYECDYKNISMNTKIITKYEGKEISITGNIFSLITDPLTVKDSNGKTLGYAGDAYGFIKQDDHGIYVNDVFEMNMCGEVDFLGNTYTLKNADGNTIATADFNFSSTYGEIVDTKGNLIAVYSSLYIAHDYEVVIYDNEVCSDLAILMIMASYTSDYIADER